MILMLRKEWLYALMALVGGIIGGMCGNRIWESPPAFAAERAPRTVSAQQFILVDAHGKERGSLALNSRGEPSLELYDTSGKARDVFGVSGDNPDLRLNDAHGTTRVLLSINSDDVPALRLYDAQGRPRTLLGVDNQGEPALDFYSDNGKLLRELP
jgi:hypothetical protein